MDSDSPTPPQVQGRSQLNAATCADSHEDTQKLGPSLASSASSRVFSPSELHAEEFLLQESELIQKEAHPME
ncbi:hypothetical protein FKM82_020195 [Ascaphus truei]